MDQCEQSLCIMGNGQGNPAAKSAKKPKLLNFTASSAHQPNVHSTRKNTENLEI